MSRAFHAEGRPPSLPMPTVTLSHYELLERIAEGGMGVVYKARDTRLGRLVALKLLSPDLNASPEDVERLFDEARAISQLNHPNVATVYEVDRHAHEPFMAMEYLPGGTLRTHLREVQKNGGLSARRIVDCATQIAKGLAHAHRHGIVHQDVKADNVLLTADGSLKLTDFGVAQVAGRPSNGNEPITAGTVAYMSPEQAQGLKTDHRSDIFSYGVLLYEMAAGKVPFSGPREELILYDIVNTPTPPLRDVRGGLPEAFYRLVEKTLEKSPGNRYASMDEVIQELRLVSKDLSMTDTKELRPLTSEPTIAVLPFVDMSPEKDQEYFCDGITEEIINGLASVKGLKVVSRTSSFRFKEAAYDIREIGKQLGVQTVVEGSVRKVGNHFRITAQHIDVASGYHLWSQRFDREMSDLFVVQDEIAQAIVDNLRSHLIGAVPKQIVRKLTENVGAYNLYLEGRFHLNQRTEAEIRR
ncbi:MAG TPA: protein kinase, partial [Bryobacterales bacterium]|nr:protein kinase [Bryobacterales bacterium]